MYRKLLIAVASASLAACARGTQVTAGGEVSPATPATRNYLPAGTAMNVRLNQSLSTANRNGDQFAATVTDPVYAQDNSVAVPAGATLGGHVTGVYNGTMPTDRNVIRLNFDEIQMNGRTYPFSGSISNVSVNNSSSAGMSNTTVRDATAGAAAGAVLGAVLSGGELSKIVTGGLLGAAAGTAISMGTGSASSAVIPAGSLMTVRSNQGVQIR